MHRALSGQVDSVAFAGLHATTIDFLSTNINKPPRRWEQQTKMRKNNKERKIFSLGKRNKHLIFFTIIYIFRASLVSSLSRQRWTLGEWWGMWAPEVICLTHSWWRSLLRILKLNKNFLRYENSLLTFSTELWNSTVNDCGSCSVFCFCSWNSNGIGNGWV